MSRLYRAFKEHVEHRLLEGENEVRVVDPLGRVNVYRVPGWREKPLTRLRIEKLRWFHRHAR